MKKLSHILSGSIATGLLILIPGNSQEVLAHTVTTPEIKRLLKLHEIHGNVNALCLAQMLGFWDTKRAQEFTTPLLINTVNSGKLSKGDPQLIYNRLDSEFNINKNCPGIISESVLMKTSDAKAPRQ